MALPTKPPAVEIDVDGFSIDEEEDEAVPEHDPLAGLAMEDMLEDTLAPPMGAPAPATQSRPPAAPVYVAPMAFMDDPPLAVGKTSTVLLAGAVAASYAASVTGAGYVAHTVESGVEALAGLDAVAPDVVVTQMDLGDLSGMEIMQAAKGVHPNVRFVVMDDPSMPQHIVAMLGEGSVEFVPAGSTPDRLLKALAKASGRPPPGAAAGRGSLPPVPSTPAVAAGKPAQTFNPFAADIATPKPEAIAPASAFGVALTPPPMPATPAPQAPSAAAPTRAMSMPPTASRPTPPPSAGAGAHELNSLRAQLTQALEETTRLRLKLQSVEADAHQAGVRASTAEREASQTAARVQSLEGEAAALKQMLVHAEAVGQRWQQQAEEIQQQALAVTQQVGALQSQMQAQAAADSQKVQAAQSQLAPMAGRVMQLEQELSLLRAKNSSGDAEVTAARSTLAAVMDERAQFEARALAAESRVDQAEGMRGSLEGELSLLRARFGALEADLGTARSMLAQTMEAKAMAEGRLAGLEAHASGSDQTRIQLEQELSAARARASAAEADLQSARVTLGQAMEARAAVEARVAAVEANSGAGDQLRAQLQQEIGQLRARYSSLENDFGATRSAYGTLLDQKSTVDAQLDALQARAANADQARAHVEQELGSARLRLASLESETASSRAALQSALDQRASVEQRVTGVEMRATAAEQARAQAENALREAWKEIDAVKADLRKKDLELINATTAVAGSGGAAGGGAAATDAQIKEAVEKATSEIRRLVEAVSPLAWGVEQAATYIETVGSGAEKDGHSRQLKLLLKVLGKLKEKAEATR